MRAGGGAAVGVVTELVDVEGTLGVGVVAGDVPGDGGGGTLAGLLEGHGAGDLSVTTENSNCPDWSMSCSRRKVDPMDSELGFGPILANELFALLSHCPDIAEYHASGAQVCKPIGPELSSGSQGCLLYTSPSPRD